MYVVRSSPSAGEILRLDKTRFVMSKALRKRVSRMVAPTVKPPVLIGSSPIELNFEAKSIVKNEMVGIQCQVVTKQDDVGSFLDIGFRLDGDNNVEQVREGLTQQVHLIDIRPNAILPKALLEVAFLSVTTWHCRRRVGSPGARHTGGCCAL